MGGDQPTREETIELKLQIEALQAHITRFDSAATKFKKLRLMPLFAAMCAFIVPGSLEFAFV